MSDLRKAAQQALQALEYTIKPLCMCWAGCEDCEPSKAPDIEKAITALRAALAQEQAEPLTDEEIDEIFKQLCSTVGASYKTMARAVEKKVRGE